MAKQSDKQAEQGVMTDDVSVSTQTHSQDKPKRTRKKKDPADVALDVQVGDVSAVSDTAGQPKSTKAKVKADQTKAKQAKTSQTKNTEDTDSQAVKPKRTRKKAVKADISEEAHAQQAVDESATDERGRPRFGAKEAILEFVEVESGSLVLREVGTDEALVSIAFADKVKDMVGAEHIQSIGQHMISAAIATVMERQMRQYHAHVYDEAPKRFS
ncbi:hypothetical protein [Moraxella lacunata]|uniref:hypothetical protein n=1 Tax=Moraxella lacunata TaxID=477 RepID=UPI000A97D394|nr:hypothetical protein [Moraxella lacunata]